MKKTIIASVIVLMSSSAMAGDYFSSYEKKNSSVELSAINYSLDNKVNINNEAYNLEESQVGARIRYQSRDSLNFGYQLSHEGFNYDDNGLDLTLQLSTIGVNYHAELFSSSFYLKPEFGIYHLQGDAEIESTSMKADDAETDVYGKITFGGTLVDNKLDAKVYYTHYNHDADEVDNGAFGAQLNYSFNRDFDLMLHVDKYEDITMFGVGISVKYW
jgi:hypothetical protein